MDNTTEHKTRRRAKAMNGIALTTPAPKQTLPQPAAWQKREPPMQTILNRLKEYERRLKRIMTVADEPYLDGDNAYDKLTRIYTIAEGKDR